MYPNITIKHDTEDDATIICVQSGEIGVKLNCYSDDDGTAIIDVRETRGKRIHTPLAFIAEGQPTRNDAPPPVTNSMDNNGVTVLRDAFNQIDSYFREDR
jgi:hypothetical protein